MKAIYLDNAATTYPKPTVVNEAVFDCLSSYSANTKRGSNSVVRVANKQLSLARNLLSGHLGCQPAEVIFVPSATYGINLVLQGYPLHKGDTIYISPFEHNAVTRVVEYLRTHREINVRLLPIDHDCNLDAEETIKWFRAQPPALVAIAHASNVTGDVLPLKEVIELTHEFGGKVLVDAAQTVGVYTPYWEKYKYDFLAFSSHKGLYGIPGSGGLVIKEVGEKIRPLVFGGTGSHSENLTMPTTMPDRFEAGTLPLPAIVSMRAGLDWLESVGIETVRDKVKNLCMIVEGGLEQIPGIKVFGRKSAFGNTGIVSFTSSWMSPQEINMVLDARGISIRAGLHCAPVSHETLGTMPNGTVRVSPSYFNSEQDMYALLEVIECC